MMTSADLHAALTAIAERVRSATSHVAVFPLVSRLERWVSPGVPIGGDEPAEREHLHFSHGPDFNHPAGEVIDVEVVGEPDGPSVTLKTTFLGLLGTESPLPELLSEDVLLADDDGAMQVFFDVFQHRLLSLFYRLWRRYSLVLAFDGDGVDGLSRCLQSFVGVDAFAPNQSAGAAPPLFALGLSDLSRCAPTFLDTAALEAILGRLFPELSARVVHAEPRPLRADPEDLTLLGEAHSTLGVDYAYGDEALDTDGVVRIVVGPVGRAVYEELLPGGARHRVLQPLLDEWLASRAKAELEILVPSGEAPSFTLGADFGGALGVDTRLAEEDTRLVRVRILLSDDPTAVRPSYHDDV
jgi:type VI secretion system protein ImpH